MQEEIDEKTILTFDSTIQTTSEETDSACCCARFRQIFRSIKSDPRTLISTFTELPGVLPDALWFAVLIDLCLDLTPTVFGLSLTAIVVGSLVAIWSTAGNMYCQNMINLSSQPEQKSNNDLNNSQIQNNIIPKYEPSIYKTIFNYFMVIGDFIDTLSYKANPLVFGAYLLATMLNNKLLFTCLATATNIPTALPCLEDSTSLANGNSTSLTKEYKLIINGTAIAIGALGALANWRTSLDRVEEADKAAYIEKQTTNTIDNNI